MVYILNTEIPENKPISSAIQAIFGVGKKRSLFLCQEFGIKPQTKLKLINKNIQNKIINYIQKEYITGNDLKKILIETNKEHIEMRNYKGNRIKNKLPRRGQRTHTNSKTAKKY
jgi:small subunit ribosomal protein S13